METPAEDPQAEVSSEGHWADPVFPASAPPAARKPPPLERPPLQRPMFFVALAWLIGTLLGRVYPLPAGPMFLAIIAALALTTSQLWNARHQRGHAIQPALGALMLLLLVGWFLSGNQVYHEQAALRVVRAFEPYKLIRAEGELSAAPTREPDALRFRLTDVELVSAEAGDTLGALPLDLRVSLTRGPWPQEIGNLDSVTLHAGDRVVVWGRLYAPRTPSDPADFDEERWMLSQGLCGNFRLNHTGDIEFVRHAPWMRHHFQRAMTFIRGSFTRHLRGAISPPYSEVAVGMLLGDRTQLSDATEETFARLGLSHLLSVSGMHVGFILFIVLPLTRLARCRPRLGTVIGLCAVIAYAALTGWKPPVMRATLMIGVILGAQLLGRFTTTHAALATALFISLVFDPRNLMRVDWQLSYLCIVAIVMLAPAIYQIPFSSIPKMKDEPPPDPIPDGGFGLFLDRAGYEFESSATRLLVHYIWRPISLVLAVQIMLLPLLLETFGRISLVTFLIQPLAMAFGFMTVAGSLFLGLLGAVPGISALLGAVLEFWISGGLYVAGLIDQNPSSVLELPAMPGWVVFVYYLAIFSGPHMLTGTAWQGRPSRRQKTHVIAVVVLFFFSITLLPQMMAVRLRDDDLKLYMMDVGQGDCLILQTPNGAVMVIDGGRGSDGPASLSRPVRFLKSLGIGRIDLLVASHADADHVGGLAAMIESFPVGRFVCGPDRSDSEEFGRMEETLAVHGVPVDHVWQGDEIKLDPSVEVRVLNPIRGQDNNDASVVLLIDYADTEILLTGDIEAAGELNVAQSGFATDIEVLKVAHHGSASSSTRGFVRAFAPEVGLISCGLNNPFGHPAPEVLDRLEEFGVQPFRTDHQGTVLIRSDGGTVSVQSLKPR